MSVASGALAEDGPPTVEYRAALVIGNGRYGAERLKNPVYDATDIASKLESRGFSVTRLLDADQRQMEEAVEQLAAQLDRPGAVGLFYFAGHGVETNGRNYLIPVRADIESAADLKYRAVDAGWVLDQMSSHNKRLNLIVLDACRNNPFRSLSRSIGRGLARMSPASGSLILYATEPGSLASDGDGRNGTFTKHFLDALDVPGLSAEEVFKRTAKGVNQETGGEQVPWMEGIILGDFYFNSGQSGSGSMSRYESGFSGGASASRATRRDDTEREGDLPEVSDSKTETRVAARDERSTVVERDVAGAASGGASSPGDTVSTVIGGSDLAEQLKVVRPVTRKVGVFTQGQIGIQNLSDDSLSLEYQFRWMDRNGFVVSDESMWHRMQLGARQMKRVSSVGKSKDAYHMEVTVRAPESYFQPKSDAAKGSQVSGW